MIKEIFFLFLEHDINLWSDDDFSIYVSEIQINKGVSEGDEIFAKSTLKKLQKFSIPEDFFKFFLICKKKI